jgi:hypothetical protein
MGDDGSHHSSEFVGETEEPEVQSPLKQQSDHVTDAKGKAGVGASRQLVMQDVKTRHPPLRKRKSKGTGQVNQTPDLNVPLAKSNVIVPAGLVNSRVSQQDGSEDNSGGSMIETLKKQKRVNTQHARSTATASSSPRRAP